MDLLHFYSVDLMIVILVMGQPQSAVPQLDFQRQSLMTAHIVVEMSFTPTTGLSPFLDPSPSHHLKQQTSQSSSTQISSTLLLDFLL